LETTENLDLLELVMDLKNSEEIETYCLCCCFQFLWFSFRNTRLCDIVYTCGIIMKNIRKDTITYFCVKIINVWMDSN